MSRDATLRAYDMVEACERIERYTSDVQPGELASDELLLDAVVRNLEILGEAARHMPPEIRSLHPDIPWRELAGLRDILIHAYFRIDIAIVEDVALRRLPPLRPSFRAILEALRR